MFILGMVMNWKNRGSSQFMVCDMTQTMNWFKLPPVHEMVGLMRLVSSEWIWNAINWRSGMQTEVVNSLLALHSCAAHTYKTHLQKHTTKKQISFSSICSLVIFLVLFSLVLWVLQNRLIRELLWQRESVTITKNRFLFLLIQAYNMEQKDFWFLQEQHPNLPVFKISKVPKEISA